MAHWKETVSFRDLIGNYNVDGDELTEIKKIKPLWIERFNSIESLKHFVTDLKKVKTESGFNKWLNRVYDYCDDNKIWIEL